MMRRWRRRTTTRTDDNMDYCCEEEKEDNKDKDIAFVWIPLDDTLFIAPNTQHGMI